MHSKGITLGSVLQVDPEAVKRVLDAQAAALGRSTSAYNEELGKT